MLTKIRNQNNKVGLVFQAISAVIILIISSIVISNEKSSTQNLNIALLIICVIVEIFNEFSNYHLLKNAKFLIESNPILARKDKDCDLKAIVKRVFTILVICFPWPYIISRETNKELNTMMTSILIIGVTLYLLNSFNFYHDSSQTIFGVWKGVESFSESELRRNILVDAELENVVKNRISTILAIIRTGGTSLQNVSRLLFLSLILNVTVLILFTFLVMLYVFNSRDVDFLTIELTSIFVIPLFYSILNCCSFNDLIETMMKILGDDREQVVMISKYSIKIFCYKIDKFTFASFTLFVLNYLVKSFLV
jgi:hypothetical protein